MGSGDALNHCDMDSVGKYNAREREKYLYGCYLDILYRAKTFLRSKKYWDMSVDDVFT